ncbi:O-antigen polymerase [Nubsella zeaxanthinifaciens]|uniref:O-antigen polymerase n=1 Tax=Nubsella zeaxanthinifaciens TaxID=392412 RepID=UPI000DE27288|nr:O-antigen polymerase [Nubsella zeaxanthinifaciens]
MTDKKAVNSMFFWYAVPFLYLIFIRAAYLPTTTVVLVVFFLATYLSYYFFRSYKFSSEINFNYVHAIKWVYIIVFGAQVFALQKMFSVENFLTYRNDLFESAEFLFGSSYLYTLYNIFTYPLVICAITFLVCNNINDRISKRYIWLGFLILILDAVIKLGRFPILYVLYFLVLYRNYFKIKRKQIVFVIITVFIAAQAILFYRAFNNDAASDLSDLFSFRVLEEVIFNYQIIGYVMFEDLTKNISPYGELISFNSLAFIFFLVKTVLTKFSGTISYGWEEKNLALSEGYYSSILDGQFINAFSTNFYPIYLDLGIFGILIFGIYVGLMFGLKSENRIFKFQKHLLLFVMVFGLYQPIILTIWGIIILPFILFFGKFTLHNK